MTDLQLNRLRDGRRNAEDAISTEHSSSELGLSGLIFIGSTPIFSTLPCIPNPSM